MSQVQVRPAVLGDVASMHRIRIAVRENPLSHQTRIDESSYPPFIARKSSWVAEGDGEVVGFAILDGDKRSVWALFVDPRWEGMGVGNALHARMLRWAQRRGLRNLTLSTTAGTRAERFYRQRGWAEIGRSEDGEVWFQRPLQNSWNATVT